MDNIELLGRVVLKHEFALTYSCTYYNKNSNPFGFKKNGAEYYYIRNAQNDIIRILDITGTQVVSYARCKAENRSILTVEGLNVLH